MPTEAMQIRRRFWSDRRFRAVCRDYDEAVRAAERFAAESGHRPASADESRELANGLLAEAARMLND